MKNKLLNVLIFNKIVYFLAVVSIHIKPKFEKLKGKYFSSLVENKGLDFRIHGSATILSVENLKVGDYVRIGKDAYLSCGGGLEIGNNCQISTNFTVHTKNHNIESSAIPYDKSYVTKNVSIGDSVWIGKSCTITPGVKIGEGAIIGANTIVSKDVPPFAVVVGSKQRIVGSRDQGNYLSLKEKRAYFGKLFPDN